MLEIELSNLIDKVETCIKEKRSIKEGVLTTLANIPRNHKMEYGIYQAVVFKHKYKQIIQSNELENDVLVVLLTVFAMDGKLSVTEVSAAKSLIRVMTRNTPAEKKWSTKDIFNFLQNDEVKEKFKNDLNKIENNIDNCIRLLPSLIKYSIAMALVDGHLEKTELNYINHLDDVYNIFFDKKHNM